MRIDVRQAEKALTLLDMKNITKKGTITKKVRSEIGAVRRTTSQSFVSRTKNGDPRRARLGIQMTVYKQVIGGNVNILNPRKSSQKSITLRYKKGGISGKPRNRASSQRTNQINSYYGADRAFILRMHNGGKLKRKNANLVDFFRVTEMMKKAAENIGEFIDNEIQKTYDRFK